VDNALVSVVIPTFNYGRFVRDAVESALSQTYRPVEIVVVDDGSTDDTAAVLEPYRQRVTCLRQDNRGLSAARNTGIRAARGSFIAILDSDDWWAPEKLEAQMATFAVDPALGIVSCNSALVDLDGQPYTGLTSPVKSEAPDRRAFVRKLLRGNCVSGGSSAVVRRTCFDSVGLFDETLKSAEDWDMWLRICSRYPIAFVPARLTFVRVNPHSMSGAGNAAKMLASELRVLRKFFSDAPDRIGAYDRGMAYSCRYADAAQAYLSVDEAGTARRQILKALLSNPLWFASQPPLVGLLARLLVGERMFAVLARAKTGPRA